MITIKKETKQSIQYLMIIICILASIFFGAYKFSLWADYTEEYSYELEEVKSGTYAIYNTVSSTVPAHNYNMVTICYNGQIHVFQGTVNICQTSNKPHVDIISKPHKNYSDEITIYVPKGTIEFAEGVGVR